MARKAFAYYNEHDLYAATWLKELIRRGLIADGVVDIRDIQAVSPADLKGFVQHHFFAGIGIWSYALRQAGWPDDIPVWTGSCPCQPFSISGQKKGFADERHLWPIWFALIEKCSPHIVFGEQVASKDGLAWLDVVCADLENEDYAIGSVDTCAAGFGAPHIRQRLYFVAESAKLRWRRRGNGNSPRNSRKVQATRRGTPGFVGNADLAGLQRYAGNGESPQKRAEATGSVAPTSVSSALADTNGSSRRADQSGRQAQERIADGGTGAVAGYWKEAEWIYCTDEKYRSVEPGSFPLAYGDTSRMGRLRAYGNALVAPQAIEFVQAYLEVKNE